MQSHAAVGLGLLRMYAARYDDAADWFERGLKLSAGEAIDVKNIGNLGWCYRMLGDTEKAVPLLLETVAIATRQGLAENAAIALFHLGEVHIQLQDLRAARGYFVRAQALWHKLGQKDLELEAFGLLQVLALEQRDTAAARAYAAEASSLLGPGSAGRLPTMVEARLHAERGDQDAARQVYERIADPRADQVTLGSTADQRWQALAELASLEVAQGNTAAAARAFQRAQQAIEEMRSKLQQDTYDFLLFSSLNDFYGRYAAFLVDQGRASEALALVDRSRGRVLWERLAPGAAAVSPERFEPAARESRAVLLSYWLGERSFLWVVTAASTEVHELPPAAQIRSRVERYQELVQRSRDPLEMPASATGDLYTLLVAPAQSRIQKGSRVVIVPDGALHELSFDTLVVPSPVPHYWIEDVVTMRAPSLGLLTAPRAPSAPPDRALLAIGDPVQPSHEFPALPNAGREMAEVVRHFPAAKVVSVSGAAATPPAYRDADPSRFAYIHFAAHATSQAEQPLESAVVLSQKDLGFKLYAHEIVTLPIRAEVVTLSACRGAGARAYRGEGLVGFAWAFLRAGARQVVAGLWNVEDASTARVMSGLYGHLASGMSPPEALREARLALVHDPGAYRKPFYWGPFVVYVQQQGVQLAAADQR